MKSLQLDVNKIIDYIYVYGLQIRAIGGFRRYSKIISDKSNPVEELIIYISNNNQDSFSHFQHLGEKYNVPTKIELIPWQNENEYSAKSPDFEEH